MVFLLNDVLTCVSCIFYSFPTPTCQPPDYTQPSLLEFLLFNTRDLYERKDAIFVIHWKILFPQHYYTMFYSFSFEWHVSLLLCNRTEFHCRFKPGFLYPFTFWSISGIIPHWSNYTILLHQTCIASISVKFWFDLGRFLPKSHTAKSWGSCI